MRSGSLAEELTLDLEGVDDVGPANCAPAEEPAESLPENHTIDYVSNRPILETPKEQVRQRILRALIFEFGVDPDDMALDFPVPVVGADGKRKRRKADIAIFEQSTDAHVTNLRRVVICKPPAKNGNTATKIRTPEQAQRELDELQELMGDEDVPCEYGLWTNGLDMYFLAKRVGPFGPKFIDIADWPQAGEGPGSRSLASRIRLRRADADMLRMAFRRCHDFIHGNEGMPKDAAFWQFLYLLFTKMYDERLVNEEGKQSRFYVGMTEPFDSTGQNAIADRIMSLFTEVKRKYPLFGPRDQIVLSKRALAFLVANLASYDLTSTDIDAKGIAYQELVGANLRGDRGQYFTPRGAVELMVSILDPQENETVLDPACGTGGFLRQTLQHLHNKFRDADGVEPGTETAEQVQNYTRRLRAFAERYLFGADFDPFLVRATKMNILTVTGAEGGVFHIDSLAFPGGSLDGVAEANKRVPFESVDVLMTNPPFGSDIKIADPDVLQYYRKGVARPWTRDRTTGKLVAGQSEVPSMTPEQLFVQRAVDWVRPGGRVGLVLPNGILSNPGPTDQAIRQWILDNCWVLASVELPVQTFIVDANVNIQTTLLFLKKKTKQEQWNADLGASVDYPVFMAVAEQVGFDRRGNPVYVRRPDGTVVLTPTVKRERVRLNGREVVRELRRDEKELDNDLPKIAQAYRDFRAEHPEPGEPRGRRR